MTKLDKAADDYENGQEETGVGWAFYCGAKWALEQMTSNACRHAAILAYGDFSDGESDEQKWTRVLAAVRKEIES